MKFKSHLFMSCLFFWRATFLSAAIPDVLQGSQEGRRYRRSSDQSHREQSILDTFGDKKLYMRQSSSQTGELPFLTWTSPCWEMEFITFQSDAPPTLTLDYKVSDVWETDTGTVKETKKKYEWNLISERKKDSPLGSLYFLIESSEEKAHINATATYKVLGTDWISCFVLKKETNDVKDSECNIWSKYDTTTISKTCTQAFNRGCSGKTSPTDPMINCQN